MNIKDIIIKPILTEKSTKNVSKNVYLFQVNLKANKNQIKEAIETLFKVKVDKVRVVVRKGKKKRVGRRLMTKKTSNKKIAYVSLKEGKLEIFPKS